MSQQGSRKGQQAERQGRSPSRLFWGRKLLQMLFRWSTHGHTVQVQVGSRLEALGLCSFFREGLPPSAEPRSFPASKVQIFAWKPFLSCRFPLPLCTWDPQNTECFRCGMVTADASTWLVWESSRFGMAQRMVPSSGGGAMNIGLSQEPTPAKVKMVSAAGVLFAGRPHRRILPSHPHV
jgi:hypothetical protein